MKETLKKYLQDIKDVLEAKKRVNEPQRELITLDELKKEFNTIQSKKKKDCITIFIICKNLKF